MHGRARGRGETIDVVARDQRNFPYLVNHVQNNYSFLVYEGYVLVRFDEDERDAIHRASQPLRDLDCPLVSGYILVAENVDLHTPSYHTRGSPRQ